MESERFQKLYVVAPSLAGPCKVGLAFEPESRCRDLQIGNHRRLRVYNVTPCHKSAELERQVHAYLAPFCLSGEWFDVSVRAAQEAIARACYGDEFDYWAPIELQIRAEEVVARCEERLRA